MFMAELFDRDASFSFLIWTRVGGCTILEVVSVLQEDEILITDLLAYQSDLHLYYWI